MSTAIAEIHETPAESGVNYLNATLRHQVVAADAGPQAHRIAVPRVHHADVFRGRNGGGHDAASSGRAAGRALRTGNLQQDVFNARNHHGVFLPGPFDSGDAREFPDPPDDRRARRGLPEAEPDELVHFHHRRGPGALRHAFRRRGHRLDVLSALQQPVLAHARGCRGARRFHRRVFFHPHGPELHRHDSQDALPRNDLVPLAALYLGDVRDQPHLRAGNAGYRHHAFSAGHGANPPRRNLRPCRWRRPACCSSICSGSIRTPPCTS